MGKNRETLRRWGEEGIGPPFIKIGNVAHYRSDLLEMYHPLQGEVEAFPVSWEERQTLNELMLMRLLFLQVLENWKEGEGYRLNLDGEFREYKSRVEVELYLKTLNNMIFAVEAGQLNSPQSRTAVEGNRVLNILNRLVERDMGGDVR